MNSDPFFKLMTLVLLCFCLDLWAAPGESIQLKSNDDHSSEPNNSVNEAIEERMLTPDQTLLHKAPPLRRAFYYPFKRSFSLLAGVLLDLDRIKQDSEVPFAFTATYMFAKRKSPRWEGHLSVLTDSTVQVGLSQRYNFNEPHHYRSFFKYGVSLQVNPDEKFATTANLKNYFATLSIGMEDVLSLPRSVRLEVQGLLGTESQSIIFYVGSSWGLSSSSR